MFANQDSINLRVLARLWETVFKAHRLWVNLENDIPLTGYTKMGLVRFMERLVDPPSPRALARVGFGWDWLNHLRYQTTEDDFWAQLGLYREDYPEVMAQTEEPRIRLSIDFYFQYNIPLRFERWDRAGNEAVPVAFAEEVTFLSQVGEKRLADLAGKMLDLVSEWFPLTQVPYPDSPFDAVDTQTITMTPRVELVYTRQAEAPFAVGKISTQAYHDVFLPRAWDGEMDYNYPSERDFVLAQFEAKFDEVAANIAGALEQLALVAEQEQHRQALQT